MAARSNDLIILDEIIRQMKAEVAPDMKNDDYFEVLVAQQITKDYDLTYDQIEEGILAGGLDGGIDAFYIFLNGLLVEDDTDFPQIREDINVHVVIAQAKNKTGFEEQVVSKLIEVSEDIFAFENSIADFKDVYNDKLLETADRFRKVYQHYQLHFPNLEFTYCYASRGNKPTPNMITKSEKLKKKILALFSASKCEFNFLGASDLLSLIRRRPKTTFELKLSENAISPNEGTGFIGLVKLHDYFDFITDDSGKLIQHIFEANVRDWQGNNNTVNKQIMDTLRNPKEEDFWWLNNGVTILSSSADIQGRKTMQISNPEVVNGLQTSHAIYNYFASQQNGKEDDRNLLVRIIVPEAEESRDRIILATNSQTPITVESLKASQKIHRDIEAHLLKHDIYYDRRRNYWQLNNKPLSRIVSIKKLAQAVMAAAQYDPSIAKGRPSDIFKHDETYNRVFNSDYPIELYGFCSNLLIKIESLLKMNDFGTELSQRSISQIKFHVMTHVVIRCTRLSSAVPSQIAKLSVDNIGEELLIESIGRVLDIFIKMEPNNITSKSSEFAGKVIDDAQMIR